MTQPPESPRDPSEGAAPDEPRAPWAAPEQPPAEPAESAAAPEQTSAASTESAGAPAGDWTQPASPQWTPPPGQPTPPQWPLPPAQPAAPGQWPTQPAQGPWEQPAGQWAPQPGTWSEQSPPAQGPWAQATPGQGDWNQPPQAGQPGWEHLGPPLQPNKARRRGRAPLVATVAAVALIGGGTATYLAVSDTQSGYKGAASAQEAVSSLVSDLNKSDILGILDHLAPGERASLLDPVKESISQAKRLHVLKASADAGHLAGLDVTAKNITYDQTDESINDHVKIVKLTGGTVTVNADLSKVPFTDEYVNIVFPHGLPSNSKSNQSIDIADIARERRARPHRGGEGQEQVVSERLLHNRRRGGS